jgi:hypothetical protein
MTDVNTGSLIEASTKSSFETGSHMNTGSLRVFFQKSTNPFIFTQPPTHTAPSGNIPSFQTLLSSSRTK